MKAHNILTKISVIFITLGILVLLPKGVDAAQNLVQVDYHIDFTLKEDDSARVKYTLELLNMNDSFVDEIIILLPYELILDMELVVDGASPASTAAVMDSGSTKVEVSLATKAIRSGETSVIEILFDTPKFSMSDNGFRTASIIGVDAAYSIQDISYRISFPISFGELLWSSAPYSVEDDGVIRLNSTPAYLELIWGHEEYQFGISEDSIGGDAEYNAVGMPRDISGRQEVEYLDVSGASVAGVDQRGNIFAIIPSTRRLYYTADITVTSASPEVQPGVKLCYQGARLPGALAKVVGTPVGKYEEVLEYFERNYSLMYLDNPTEFDGQVFGIKLSQEKGSLNRLELACGIQTYLRLMDVNAVISYGYYLGDFFDNFDSELPHVWVDIVDDELQLPTDPYLAIISDYPFAIPPQTRLIIGYLHEFQIYNAILGLEDGGARTRPTMGEFSGSSSNDSIDVKTHFPDHAFSGEFFSGRIDVYNYSNEFMTIAKLLVDEEDYTSSISSVYPGLKSLLIPHTGVSLRLDNLREPNFLKEGSVTHTISVETEIEEVPVQRSRVTIQYEPDTRLMLLAGVVVVLTVVVIVFVLSRATVRRGLHLHRAYEEVGLRRKSQNGNRTETSSTREKKVISMKKLG